MLVYTNNNNYKYNVSQEAEWFNAVPHLDITLSSVNTTFDPTNSAYLEAIGILIAVPGFWLILTLLAFLVFFLCRCCDGNLNKKRKLTPLKWALGIVALLCCGALAVGLFGNQHTHEGLVKVENTPRVLARLVASIRGETTKIESLLTEKINPNLDDLSDAFRKPPHDGSLNVQQTLHGAVSNMRNNVTQGINKIMDINSNLDRLDFNYYANILEQVEMFRWPITMGALGILVLVCFILIWGVIRHSRCLLILFSVLGLLSVVICWICVSLYLGICVAGSDFCLDPEPFLYKQARGVVSSNVLTFYLHCDELPPSPFSWTVKDGLKSLEDIQSNLAQVKSLVREHYPDNKIRDTVSSLFTQVNRTEKILQDMSTPLDCKDVFKEYISAMDALCTNVLEGTSFMLASAAGAGLLFTVLIWVASHTWIHIRKKKYYPPRGGGGHGADEEDPFLPSRRNHQQPSYGCSRYSHTPPQTPHFTSSLNGRSGSREDQTCLQGRYTPPPAYDNL